MERPGTLPAVTTSGDGCGSPEKAELVCASTGEWVAREIAKQVAGGGDASDLVELGLLQNSALLGERGEIGPLPDWCEEKLGPDSPGKENAPERGRSCSNEF